MIDYVSLLVMPLRLIDCQRILYYGLSGLFCPQGHKLRV